MLRICWNCLAVEKRGNGMQRCSQCKLVKYCNRKCQVKHWKQKKPRGHKYHCHKNTSSSTSSVDQSIVLIIEQIILNHHKIKRKLQNTSNSISDDSKQTETQTKDIVSQNTKYNNLHFNIAQIIGQYLPQVLHFEAIFNNRPEIDILGSWAIGDDENNTCVGHFSANDKNDNVDKYPMNDPIYGGHNGLDIYGDYTDGLFVPANCDTLQPSAKKDRKSDSDNKNNNSNNIDRQKLKESVIFRPSANDQARGAVVDKYGNFYVLFKGMFPERILFVSNKVIVHGYSHSKSKKTGDKNSEDDHEEEEEQDEQNKESRFLYVRFKDIPAEKNKHEQNLNEDNKDNKDNTGGDDKNSSSDKDKNKNENKKEFPIFIQDNEINFHALWRQGDKILVYGSTHDSIVIAEITQHPEHDTRAIAKNKNVEMEKNSDQVHLLMKFAKKEIFLDSCQIRSENNVTPVGFWKRRTSFNHETKILSEYNVFTAECTVWIPKEGINMDDDDENERNSPLFDPTTKFDPQKKIYRFEQRVDSQIQNNMSLSENNINDDNKNESNVESEAMIERFGECVVNHIVPCIRMNFLTHDMVYHEPSGVIIGTIGFTANQFETDGQIWQLEIDEDNMKLKLLQIEYYDNFKRKRCRMVGLGNNRMICANVRRKATVYRLEW